MMDRSKPIVLIIDDSPADIDVLVEMLSPNHTLRVALDGPQGVKKGCAAPRPDLVLLDVVMPGMDGYEVCNLLKENESTRNIPVIFITVQDNPEDELHGLACGAVDYIRKPFSPAIVKARVKTHLALASVMAALENKNRQLEYAARIKELVFEINRHDMKGPLMILTQFPALIRRKHELNPTLEEGLNVIEHAALRVLEMVNHTQDLHRIETGTYELIPELVPLLPVFEVIQREHASFIRGKSLDLRILSGDSAPPEIHASVFGEVLLCYCLFSNLVRNALHAAPNGSVVTITLESEKNFRIAHIHNEGEVSREIQSHFFEKYVTSGKVGGVGLGTYSARLMARTMNGDVTMSTSAAVGTTLTVRLPLPPPGAETRQTLESPFAIYASRFDP
ncbi:MAG: hybrid sensor histidine kinase/response regulator [Magnetococcales bacterium]|nr:hybrid sensor histidine kinase/response regulator [Magnetococcales bacterium]